MDTVINDESHSEEDSSENAKHDGNQVTFVKEKSDYASMDTALTDNRHTTENIRTSVTDDHHVAGKTITDDVSEKSKLESLDAEKDKDDCIPSVHNVSDQKGTDVCALKTSTTDVEELGAVKTKEEEQKGSGPDIPRDHEVSQKDLHVCAAEAPAQDEQQVEVKPKEEQMEMKIKDEDLGSKIPREHEPLWSLLSQIPKKAQRGLLMQCDLILTSVHADENFIALGTNIGIVFLYRRKEQTLERLKSEVITVYFEIYIYVMYIMMLLVFKFVFDKHIKISFLTFNIYFKW